MQTNDLIEIFHDCVTRMQNGATIEDCLDLYPQYADALLPMLEAVQIPKRAQVSDDEVAVSQQRVRVEFEQALNQPTRVRFRPMVSRVASFVLLVLFVGSLLTTGVVVVAQDSIPGDSLYGVKRLTEQLRLSFADDETGLREEFAQRRINETRQVIQRRRATTVEFAGMIDQIDNATLTVAGFSVELSPRLRTIDLQVGMRVNITAQTQQDRTIIVTAIQVEGLSEIVPQTTRPTLIPTQSLPTLPAMTITRTPTSTLTAIQTDVPTGQPTERPQPTATVLPEIRPSMTPTQTRESGDCVPDIPSDWIAYSIQAGDTPSGIAVGTELSLAELYQVNCHINPRLIVVGEVIYVPYEPRLRASATATSEPIRTPETVGVTPVDRPINPTEQTRPTATDVPSRERDNNSGSRQREDNSDSDDDDSGGNAGRGR